MVHRIECNNSSIDDIYYQRNLVFKIDELIEIINIILKSKYSFGTLKQSIETNNHLHITFDDGYKEHLTAAKKLKKEFGLEKEYCSFAINIGNSLLSDFFCRSWVTEKSFLINPPSQFTDFKKLPSSTLRIEIRAPSCANFNLICLIVSLGSLNIK